MIQLFHVCSSYEQQRCSSGEEDAEEEEEMRGSDDDEQEDPGDYCKGYNIYLLDRNYYFLFFHTANYLYAHQVYLVSL